MDGRGDAIADDSCSSDGRVRQSLRPQQTARPHFETRSSASGIASGAADGALARQSRNAMALANILDTPTYTDFAPRTAQEQSRDGPSAGIVANMHHPSDGEAQRTLSLAYPSSDAWPPIRGAWDRDIPSLKPWETSRAPGNERSPPTESNKQMASQAESGALKLARSPILAPPARGNHDYRGKRDSTSTIDRDGFPVIDWAAASNASKAAELPWTRSETDSKRPGIVSKAAHTPDHASSGKQPGRRPRVWLDENSLAVPIEFEDGLVDSYRMGVQAAIRAIEAGSLSIRDRQCRYHLTINSTEIRRSKLDWLTL